MFGKQNILDFDIAVCYAFLMDVPESFADLNQQLDDCFFSQWIILSHDKQVEQSFVCQLHEDETLQEILSFYSVHTVDTYDVFMISKQLLSLIINST